MKTPRFLFSGSGGGRKLPLLLALLGAGAGWGGGMPPHHSQPPEVALTVATEGPYVAPETLLLSAQVADADGWVNRVEFLANKRVIGVAKGDSRSMGPLNPFRFQWRGVLAGDYVLRARAFDNTGASTLSDPVKLRVEQAQHAFIVIRQPEPDTVFTAPARVEIAAVAVDPEADIRKVTFYANDEKLGVSELFLRIAIIPGNPMRHHWVWEDAPAGEYRITAVAEDLHGDEVRSEPVPIVIEPASRLARVTIEPLKSHAEEGAEGEAGELRFLIRRHGSSEVEMPVYYTLSGTATAGEDYAELPGQIVIPEGETSVELVVRSLPDEAPEGEESVVVTIEPPACPEIFPPPPFCYQPGHPAKARGVIGDGSILPPPELPVVRIEAVVPETTEPSPETKVAPGVFRLSRTGPVDEPLEVACFVGGTATPNEDYQFDPPLNFVDVPLLPGMRGDIATILIPAGSEAVEIRVAAMDDDLPEPAETVLAKLLPLPFMWPDDARLMPGLPEFEGPYLVDPEHSRAKVVIQDNDTAGAAELVIQHPPEGMVFPLGVPIPVNVLAVDPNGYLPRVEVFADDERIGVSEIVFIRPPDPGEPIAHEVLWKHPAPGEHALVARAVTQDGVKVKSEPVHITVEAEIPEPVTLEIFAPHPQTAEPAEGEEPAPVAFVVRRVSGPRGIELPVFIKLSGTAENGVDYAEIGPDFRLPAGADTLEIPVVALPDDLAEGKETVIAQLLPPPCIAIFPPPPECYRVGRHDTAKIVIHDATPPGNLPPRVAIAQPRQGAVLPLGEPVTIVAEASDPDGEVVRMRLWLGHEELASGEGDRLESEWTPEQAGKYTFTAGATDNDGAERISRHVTVFVREGGGMAFARRELPAAYVPGESLPVQIVVQPPDFGTAWAIEDRPPEGWAVSDVSDDGVFDPATGKVKFGPFVEHEPRTLVYQVTPPDDATGPQKFAGRASVDGKSFRLGGDRLLRPANDRHPADRSPADMALTMNEVTAYTAAWKDGEEWPEGPVPIPLSYVTRAGALWKGGEAYLYDPEAGAPPACWVNAPLPLEPEAGLAGRPHRGGAERVLPAGCRPGAALATKLSIQPPAGTLAWAVEEIVPPGWRVTDISDDGQFDPEQRRIRWGLFFTDAPTELSYRAIAPNGVTSVAHFRGWVSFDGHVQPLGGRHDAIAADASTTVEFVGVEHRRHEGVRLRLRGAPGQLVVVEASDDLRHWHEVAPVGLVDGELVFEDSDAGDTGPRFYRARPIGP